MIDNKIANILKKVINPSRFRFVVILYNTTLDIPKIKEFLEKNYPNAKHNTIDISQGYQEFAKEIYQDNNFVYIDDLKKLLETKELYYPFNQRRDKIASYATNIIAFYPKSLKEKLYKDAVTFIPDLWEFRTDIVEIEGINKDTIKPMTDDLPLQYQYGSMTNQDKIAEIVRLQTRLKEDNLRDTEKAILLNNLAGLYEAQGRYEEAEPLYKKALEISEKVLGEEHPNTATSYNNLAGLYESQGRYEEAEPLYKKALGIREKVLGEEHPDTAISYNNLAFLYLAQDRYNESISYEQKAVDIMSKLFPNGHPNLDVMRENLSYIKSKANE